MSTVERRRAAAAVLLVAATIVKKPKKSRKKRQIWVKDWLKKRKEKSIFFNLFGELGDYDTFEFKKYIRMDSTTLEMILSRIGPRISKQRTKLREPISAQERLVVTLRFLITGESYLSLHYQFRMSDSIISKFVPEVCDAIYKILGKEFLRFPKEEEEWSTISDNYLNKWDFPNCFGALDGKHIQITRPNNSGSKYYNYKGFYSIVLMALVSADYKFIYLNVGSQGRISVGGVYRNSSLFSKLSQGKVNLPEDCELPSTNPNLDDSLLDGIESIKVPFVFVADDGFSLSRRCMKPFSQAKQNSGQRIFNYRLSRARRTSENAFGILAHRFRIFLNCIQTSPAIAKKLTLASCTLHNLLSATVSDYAGEGYGDVVDDGGEIIEGQWRSEVDFRSVPLEGIQTEPEITAEEIRLHFMRHFETKGQVSWQWKHV
ncbi:putative nuclease HARBI1 [Clytia hemisphaerica]|uniref:putative nuclease HARBI1 n=1 Tax=Clytia hemisphaerica TaxID=252671 RepID=UPI0034D55318